MPNSPDVSFNALVRYEFPVNVDMFKGNMALQLDGQYVDERSLNGINHPSLLDGNYVVMNASVGWRSDDDKWEARLYVKNFTDEYYIPTVFDLATIQGTNIEQAPAPRWFGGSLRYNF